MINLINISKILQIPLIVLKIIGISSLANFLLFNLDVTKALFSFYLIGFIKSLVHLNIDRFEANITRILFYCIIALDLAITISILTLSCCFIQVVYQIRQTEEKTLLKIIKKLCDFDEYQVLSNTLKEAYIRSIITCVCIYYYKIDLTKRQLALLIY